MYVRYQHSEGTCCLHLHGRIVRIRALFCPEHGGSSLSQTVGTYQQTTQCGTPEDSNLKEKQYGKQEKYNRMKCTILLRVFVVFSAVVVQTMVFWLVTLCSLVGRY
jgi:hypothetical protein